MPKNANKPTPEQRAVMCAHSQASRDKDAKALCAAAVELDALSRKKSARPIIITENNN